MKPVRPWNKQDTRDLIWGLCMIGGFSALFLSAHYNMDSILLVAVAFWIGAFATHTASIERVSE